MILCALARAHAQRSRFPLVIYPRVAFELDTRMDIISRIVPSKYINKHMYSRDFDARYGHVRNLYTNEAEFQRRE